MISIHAISTGKIQDLPYSSKRPMRSALDKTKISTNNMVIFNWFHW